MSAITLIGLVLLVAFGRSSWNMESQLEKEINRLNPNTNSLNYLSDQTAVNEISSFSRPLKIEIISKKEDNITSHDVYKLTVQINEKLFLIRLICHTYPLNWTPYQDWEINQVEYAE